MKTEISAFSGRRLTALRAMLAASLALMLAGCYTQRDADYAKVYPRDYRERHPITLREGERTVEIFLGRNRGGLSPAQRADVLAFAQSWRRESTGGIVIEVPRSKPTDQAARDSLREIHSIFAASGVPTHGVRTRPYQPASVTLATIKLNYSKLTATAGPCGRWPNDLGPADDPAYMENRPYWNLGCAHQRNLAAMIDDPTDLVQPRGETPANSNRRSVAIEKHRKGENPSGTYTGYDAGKISDLGK
ncbi:MAG: CpaD family pilus assembly protein [Pseudolabrys sp.]|nr:CpaD family pilus assembly protein [Pseudolabrys sp.]